MPLVDLPADAQLDGAPRGGRFADLPSNAQLDPLVDPNTGQVITRLPGGTSTPGTDLLYGLRKPIDNMAILAGRSVEGAFPAVGMDTPGWATGLRASAQEAARNARQEYEQTHTGGPPDDSAMTRAGSEIIPAVTAYAMPGSTSARFLPRTLSNMGSGAATTLMTGDPNAPPSELAGQAALGAGIGAGSSILMGGTARLAEPRMSMPGSDQRAMFDLGIRPTIGQASGGAINRFEQGLTRLPFVGDWIASARRRSVLDLNRGVIQDVLDPIGVQLPKDIEIGRPALNFMSDQASTAYRTRIPAAGAPIDTTASTNLANLKNLAQGMPDAQRNEFNKQIQDYVDSKISPNGFLTGDGYKDAESWLGDRAKHFAAPGSSPWDKDLSRALLEAQNILRQNLARSSPQAAADMAAVNQAWTRLKRVEATMQQPSGDPGIFNPQQFQAAAYRGTPSPNQRMRGGGTYEETADAARRVLGPTLPDSGTPYGLNAKNLITSVAATLGEHTGAISPEMLAAAVTGGGLLGAAYNPYGQNIIANMLIRRHPALARNSAELLRALTPGVTVGGSSEGGLLGP